jgi:hypothetical protein
MNEKIRELVERCTAQEFSDCTGGFETFDKEKFAKLIVQECARVYWNIDDGEIHGEYVKALKEHFGVE